MPTGKIKFFDEKKGFGFITGDDGQEVFLPSSALPTAFSTPVSTAVPSTVATTLGLVPLSVIAQTMFAFSSSVST